MTAAQGHPTKADLERDTMTPAKQAAKSAAQTSDYWYLCGACGNVSPAARWSGEDDTLTCPVCKFVHTDSDDDPGIEDGTLEELHGR